MPPDKRPVERYLDGFNRLDREQTVFGAYRVQGKQAYDDHITEPGFSTPPELRAFVVPLSENDYK